MFSQTRTALEQFDNEHDFERMAADILNALGYANIVLIAPRGGSDEGEDITFTTESGGKWLACVTLRSDIQHKFEEDFSQRKAGEYEKYILFCTAYLTVQQKRKFARYCLETLEAEFVPFDIEALRSLLDSSFKPIRETYLHIRDDSKGVNEEALAKLRDELVRRSTAEALLLRADTSATSLMGKDELVNQAVELCSDFRQRAYRQLGIEMSVAVIDGFDRLKQMSLKAAGYNVEPLNIPMRLEKDEIAFFTTHAIRYLRETVLDAATSDAQGLLYLACMHGYCQQYHEMIKIIDKASQFSQVVQDMKAEFRERQMLLILLDACSSDPVKIEHLRKTLKLPRTTKKLFCEYVKQSPLSGDFINWIAVRKTDAPGAGGRCIVKITPPYPSYHGKVNASFFSPDGRHESIVAVDEKVSIEKLYSILNSSFILFCPID